MPETSDTVVLVPAYREEQGVGRVIDGLRQGLNPSVLVINRPDGDSTGSVAGKRGAFVLDQTGKGKGDAVRMGLEFVRTHWPETRYIGIVDADCTYPPGAIGSMRQLLAADRSLGMVVGRRENLKNNGATSQAFAWGNRVLARVHSTLNDVPLRDPLSGMRLVRAEVVRDWRPRAVGFDIECELNDYVHNVKRLDIGEVPIPYFPRVGEKKLRFRDGFTILLRMIRMAMRRNRPPPHGASFEPHSNLVAQR